MSYRFNKIKERNFIPQFWRSDGPIESKSEILNDDLYDGGWDVAPKGYEGMSVAAVAAKNPDILKDQLREQDSVVLRQARRLYIGHIPNGITGEQIQSFFVNGMKKSGIGNENSILRVNLDNHKKYAFVEFAKVEDATACLAFKEIPIDGMKLSIDRPKDYKDPSIVQQRLQKKFSQLLLADFVRERVPPSKYRIRIVGFPNFMTKTVIKKFLLLFGQLLAIEIVVGEIFGEITHIYVEYIDSIDPISIVNQLNHVKIGIYELQAEIDEGNLPPVVEAESSMIDHTIIMQMNPRDVIEPPTKILCIRNFLTDEENSDVFVKSNLLNVVQRKIASVAMPILTDTLPSKSEGKFLDRTFDLFLVFKTRYDAMKVGNEVMKLNWRGEPISITFLDPIMINDLIQQLNMDE
eukprot:TRINITY_DN529_c0_g1_i1.p1 TRINITY_DN529_c0_g1~~TRINITY_DN529_c0_g1_i1.p1  ORF type:complete len:421 (+),score=111.79 TRINITY_DN529_c0_g1_i1:43-1263(+)